VEPQEKAKDSSESTDYIERFSRERTAWSDDIVNIGRRFRDVDNLAEVQVDLYSKRQQALEYQYKLISIHSKLKTTYTAQWKRAFDEAGKNEDLRYSEKEKSKVADAMTSNLRFKVESVQNQIDFFRETIKGIDNMNFGVKHRIEIENFKAGLK